MRYCSRALRRQLVALLILLCMGVVSPVVVSQEAQPSLPVVAELHTPDRVTAGDAFWIGASVTNNGTQPLLLTVRFGCPFAQVSGNHRSSLFRIVMLPASRILQPGIWEARLPSLRVLDSLGREARLYAEPLKVVVTSDSHLPLLAPDHEDIRRL